MSWKTVKLGDAASIERRSVQPCNIKSGSIYVGLENIKSGGGFTNVKTVEQDDLASSKFMFSNEHVLFGKLRPYLAKIATPSFQGICSTDILPILPSNELDKNYLAYFLLQPKIVQLANSLCTGANLPRISPNALVELQIPLPPLAEQKRIAAILDKADEIRRKREQTIAKLDQLAQSIFVEMFGDLLVNNKGWDFKTVGEALKTGLIADVQDGNHGESHPKSSDFIANGIPFIMANCIDNGKINYEKAYKLDESWLKKLRIGFAKPNDVLLSHKGTVGEVGVVPSNYEIIILSPQTTYYRTSTGLNSVFLAGFFKTAWFQAILKKNAIQSTRAYIGITRQKDLPFFLPPLALQEQFATRIKNLEQLKANHIAALTQQTQLFASLQHQAFTGNL
jgi:type I restriction enzyme S subunit